MFKKLLSIVPHFAECLMESSEEESMIMADLVCLFPCYNCCLNILQIQKGISTARSDDTKSLKGVVLEWITPWDTPLHPPLSRSIKTTQGFHHPVMGALLCPAGLNWNDAGCVQLPIGIYIPDLVTHVVCSIGFPLGK